MSGTVIDASLRFARSNPEVLAYARLAAARTRRSVDELLLEAVERVRAARSVPAVAQQQVGIAAPRRQQRILVQ